MSDEWPFEQTIIVLKIYQKKKIVVLKRKSSNLSIVLEHMFWTLTFLSFFVYLSMNLDLNLMPKFQIESTPNQGANYHAKKYLFLSILCLIFILH